MSLNSKAEVMARDMLSGEFKHVAIPDDFVMRLVAAVRETDNAERKWVVARRDGQMPNKIELLSAIPQEGDPDAIAVEYAVKNNYSDGNRLLIIAKDSMLDLTIGVERNYSVKGTE